MMIVTFNTVLLKKTVRGEINGTNLLSSFYGKSESLRRNKKEKKTMVVSIAIL